MKVHTGVSLLSVLIDLDTSGQIGLEDCVNAGMHLRMSSLSITSVNRHKDVTRVHDMRTWHEDVV